MVILRGAACLLSAALTFSAGLWPVAAETPVPLFGRDTVLVYEMENQETTSKFVVRLAEFSPGRYLEWEDATTQGTIYMPEKAVKNAKVFLNARLFEGGVDTRGKDATTLWLSQRIYSELKEKRRARVLLDSVESWMTLEAEDTASIEVNRAPSTLPIIKVKDDRGSERWFLDSAENPLMVKHLFRSFTQSLVSITTDKANTLRWIKGKKLEHPQ